MTARVKRLCFRCAPPDWPAAGTYARCPRCRYYAILYERPRTVQGELLTADALFHTKPLAEGADGSVGKGGPIAKRRKV